MAFFVNVMFDIMLSLKAKVEFWSYDWIVKETTWKRLGKGDNIAHKYWCILESSK